MNPKGLTEHALARLRNFPPVKKITDLRLGMQLANRRIDMLERAVRQLSLQVIQQQHLMPGTAHCRSVINRHELRVFSQNGEDGILLALFSKLGTTDCRFIEFGVEDGRECISANLSLNFGWRGLLIEADPVDACKALAYFQERLRDIQAVQVVESFVTPENVNELFSVNGFTEEIDLLSIDIDGNDYWVWKAVTVIRPRVVVVEYNASFGPDRSVTVVYDPRFSRFDKHRSGFYHGASLTALAKLGNAKGYALVGCDSNGVNAFFVRRDLLNDEIVECTPEDAFYPLFFRSDQLSLEAQFEQIRHLPLIEV